MNQQLIIDDLSSIPKAYHRVLQIDPTEYYLRAETLNWFSYYKRYNSVFSETLFLQPDKTLCACGCGKSLSGRRKRWATDECSRFSNHVIGIITGRSDLIRNIMAYLYGGYKCFKCAKTDDDFKSELYPPSKKDYNNIDEFFKAYNTWMNDQNSKIHLEHVVPVHKGGGACWLSNYQFLCVVCHKEKTKSERVKF